MRFFGITVDTNTDIVAFAAFLIAAITAISQVTLWLVVFVRGVDLTLFPSDQILFRAEAFESNGPLYLRIGARMTYDNTGSIGYNATIANEYVHLKFGDGQEVSQKSQSFKTFDIEGNKLVILERKPANPFPVIAGNAASHDTYFVPFRVHCAGQNCNEWVNYWTWDKFMEIIAQYQTITVSLEAQIYGDDPEIKACTVKIDANMRDRLEKNGWYSASCRGN